MFFLKILTFFFIFLFLSSCRAQNSKMTQSDLRQNTFQSGEFNNHGTVPKKVKLTETYQVSEKSKSFDREQIRQSLIRYKLYGESKDGRIGGAKFMHFSHFCDVYIDGKPYHIVRALLNLQNASFMRGQLLMYIFDNSQTLISEFFLRSDILACRENAVLFDDITDVVRLYPKDSAKMGEVTHKSNNAGITSDSGNVWTFSNNALDIETSEMKSDEYFSTYKTQPIFQSSKKIFADDKSLIRDRIGQALTVNKIDDKLKITNFYQTCNLLINGKTFYVVDLIANTTNFTNVDKSKNIGEFTTSSEYHTLIFDKSLNLIYNQMLDSRPFFCVNNSLSSNDNFGFSVPKDNTKIQGNVLTFSNNAKTVKATTVNLNFYRFKDLIH